MAFKAAKAALALLAFLSDPAGAQTGALSVEVAPGLTATVVSLKRLPNDKLVQLDYTLTSTGTSSVDLGTADLLGGGGVRNIGLLDFAGATIHEVGTADGCLCSAAPEGDKLAAGATFSGWAWFMPPDTVSKTVAVRFGKAQPILDVPLR